jgi:hypothetical protein
MPSAMPSRNLSIFCFPAQCIRCYRSHTCRLYQLKVPPGKGQQIVPWRAQIEDAYLFRKSDRTVLMWRFQTNTYPTRLSMHGFIRSVSSQGSQYPWGRTALSRSLSFVVDLAGPEPESDFLQSLEPVDEGNQFPPCSPPFAPPSVFGIGSSGFFWPLAGVGSCCWPFDGGGS